MTFVHGHARDTGWVVSHYRRPQQAGEDQLDLEVPVPRREDDGPDGGRSAQVPSVRSIPRATASTR